MFALLVTGPSRTSVGKNEPHYRVKRTVNRPVHATVSLAIGLLSGLVLGLLFAPDPTGLVPFALALVVGAPVAGFLYWGQLASDDF